jgi:hypothetical protein
LKRWLVVGVLLFGASGCRDLDRFDTTDGSAYCGGIVSAAFVREGFPPDLRVRMTIDIDHLETIPGTLRTDDSSTGPCKPSPRLADAQMRVTEAILHDPLSTFDFGTGRDENFVAWVESRCEGPMLAVVSLMKNDDVELRLMAPPPPPAAGVPEPQPAGFALFQLTKRDNDCGF